MHIWVKYIFDISHFFYKLGTYMYHSTLSHEPSNDWSKASTSSYAYIQHLPSLKVQCSITCTPFHRSPHYFVLFSLLLGSFFALLSIVLSNSLLSVGVGIEVADILYHMGLISHKSRDRILFTFDNWDTLPLCPLPQYNHPYTKVPDSIDN